MFPPLNQPAKSFRLAVLTPTSYSCLHLEFGFPLTGLEKMENVIGLPDFSGSFSEEDYICNQESHFQEHFASQIVLRRLLVQFHGTLSQCKFQINFMCCFILL